jgi:hypothetical protein
MLCYTGYTFYSHTILYVLTCCADVGSVAAYQGLATPVNDHWLPVAPYLNTGVSVLVCMVEDERAHVAAT